MSRKVLLISIDCLRSDVVFPASQTLHGRSTLPTTTRATNLRALVSSGYGFPRAVTTSPYTTAAHASAFTGLHPTRHGVRDYFRTPLQAPTIFELASERGARTAFATDYPRILGADLGFTAGVEEYGVETQEELLVDFLNEERDAVLFLHFADLHFPYGCHRIRDHREYLDELLHAESARLGFRLESQTSGEALEAERTSAEFLVESNYRRMLGVMSERKAYDDALGLYASGVERFDQGRWARFTQILTESEILRSSDCLTILFGDHGEHWSPTAWAHFDSCDIEVLNVPIVLWGSEPVAGPEAVVGLVDVAPTVLDHLGIPMSGMDGRSLLRAPLEHRFLYSECWLSDPGEFIEAIQRVHDGAQIEEIGTLGSTLAKDAVFSNQNGLQRHFDPEGSRTHLAEIEWGRPNPDSLMVLEQALDTHYARSAAPSGVPLDLWVAMSRNRYFTRG